MSSSVSKIQVFWDTVLSLVEQFLTFWWRLLDPEDEGSTVFQIVRNCSTNYTPSHPRKYEFSVSLLWQLHISPDLACHENFLSVVCLMMPIAETVFCWMVGWTVKVRNLFMWFILVNGHEKRIVLFMHFMYYVGAVDGLAGMLYMRHVTPTTHLNSSGSVQNISKPTINTGWRSQFTIRNIQFSKIIDSVIIELSKTLCAVLCFCQ